MSHALTQHYSHVSRMTATLWGNYCPTSCFCHLIGCTLSFAVCLAGSQKCHTLRILLVTIHLATRANTYVTFQHNAVIFSRLFQHLPQWWLDGQGQKGKKKNIVSLERLNLSLFIIPVLIYLGYGFLRVGNMILDFLFCQQKKWVKVKMVKFNHL